MKFTANNQSIGELYQMLSSQIERVDIEDWDEDIFYAIQEGLPLKPITYTKTISISNDSLEIGKSSYELLDGKQMLQTLFSFIDSEDFRKKPEKYRETIWKYIVATTEIKKIITDEQKVFVNEMMNK